MTDTEEMVDERVIDAMRQLCREVEDAEYEASTPGAGRWRERMAQRHRFGRALDLPPYEPRDGIERGIIWAAVVGIALWGIVAAILWWLT